MSYEEQIARNVRAEMARQGLTQRELAAVLNVSRQSVNSRLTCKVEFKVNELKLIADHLGIDVETLYKTSGAQVVAA